MKRKETIKERRVYDCVCCGKPCDGNTGPFEFDLMDPEGTVRHFKCPTGEGGGKEAGISRA